MRGSSLRVVAHPGVRTVSGGVFAAMTGAVVIPLIFVDGTQLSHGIFPYFISVLVASTVIFGLSWLVARREGTRVGDAPDVIHTALACLASTLTQAQKWGQRLYAEAGKHDPPISGRDASLDLVRECNEWHASVSKALAEENDVPEEWRDEWRKDPEGFYPDVSPVTRDHFDVMVLWIADRLRLIEWMLRQLVEMG
jgi:hypothetical protein